MTSKSNDSSTLTILPGPNAYLKPGSVLTLRDNLLLVGSALTSLPITSTNVTLTRPSSYAPVVASFMVLLSFFWNF